MFSFIALLFLLCLRGLRPCRRQASFERTCVLTTTVLFEKRMGSLTEAIILWMEITMRTSATRETARDCEQNIIEAQEKV